MATTHLYPGLLPVIDFLISEANNHRSRDNIIVTQTGTAVKSGTLLTKVDTATTGSAAANAGNTGNPTFGTITVGAAGKPGVYDLTFTAATKFDVEDPDGIKIGSGTTGVAFSKAGIGFTLTAGGNAAVAGDGFAITVADGTGKYIPYTAAGAAGPADAILYNGLPAATGDVKAVGITNDAEVSRVQLTGLDATGEKQLLTKGIKVRGTAGLPKVATPAL